MNIIEKILNIFLKEISINKGKGLLENENINKKNKNMLIHKYREGILVEAKQYLEPIFEIHKKYTNKIKNAKNIREYIEISPYKLIYLIYPASKKDENPECRYSEVSNNLEKLSKIVKHKITWIKNEESCELSILNVVKEGKYWLFNLMEDLFKEFANEIYYLQNDELNRKFEYITKIHRTKQCIAYLIFHIVKNIMKNIFKGNIEKEIFKKGNIVRFIEEYKENIYYLSYKDALRFMEIIELLHLYEDMDYYHLKAYEEMEELIENNNMDTGLLSNLYYDFFNIDTNALIFYIGEILEINIQLNMIPMYKRYIDESGKWQKEKIDSNTCYPCSTIIEYGK